MNVVFPEPLYALVLSGEKRTTRSGKYYWTTNLKTMVGEFPGMMWDAAEDAEKSPKYPHAGDIIQVMSYTNNMAEHNNIIIGDFARLTRNDLPEDARVICDFPKASKEEMAKAIAIIQDKTPWKYQIHYDFTMECLQEVDWEKFQICPAAEKVHHNFQGGLLVHTAEVLELSRAIMKSSNHSTPRYDFVDSDVVATSAILHDAGKVNTYSISEFGVAKSEVNERTVGHIFYSMALVDRVSYKYKDRIKKSFFHEVLHCIAAHHGSPEYGSLKKVQSIEAGIVSHADYLSSRNGMMESTLREAIRTKQAPPDEYRIYGDWYFTSNAMKEYIQTDIHTKKG